MQDKKDLGDVILEYEAEMIPRGKAEVESSVENAVMVCLLTHIASPLLSFSIKREHRTLKTSISLENRWFLRHNKIFNTDSGPFLVAWLGSIDEFCYDETGSCSDKLNGWEPGSVE